MDLWRTTTKSQHEGKSVYPEGTMSKPVHHEPMEAFTLDDLYDDVLERVCIHLMMSDALHAFGATYKRAHDMTKDARLLCEAERMLQRLRRHFSHANIVPMRCHGMIEWTVCAPINHARMWHIWNNLAPRDWKDREEHTALLSSPREGTQVSIKTIVEDYMQVVMATHAQCSECFYLYRKYDEQSRCPRCAPSTSQGLHGCLRCGARVHDSEMCDDCVNDQSDTSGNESD